MELQLYVAKWGRRHPHSLIIPTQNRTPDTVSVRKIRNRQLEQGLAITTGLSGRIVYPFAVFPWDNPQNIM